MRDIKEPAIFALTLVSASAVLISIAVSQILLAAACALWLYSRPAPIRIPSYFTPLVVFFATTVLALAASPEPRAGLGIVYKFWLYSIGFLAANSVTTPRRARTALRCLLAAGAAGAVVAIAQFGSLYAKFRVTGQLADNPMVLARITGTMGHWMTFSGVQLLVWCAAVPALLVLSRRWIAPAAIISIAIVLSFTRSVWLGSAAGFLIIAAALPRRLLVALLAPVLLVGAVASGLIYQRLSMSLQSDFAPAYARRAYLEVGLKMIRDHPLFGVGPHRIPEEFPRYYKGSNLDTFYYGHLHNNFIQIAAERGLLSLGAALWFFVELYRSMMRMLRTADSEVRWLSLSGLAALTGFLVAGLFEYNFSDSEPLTLLLFIVSLHLGVQHYSRTSLPAPKGLHNGEHMRSE